MTGEMTLKPIGTIRTPFPVNRGVPIQSSMSDAIGTVEIDEEYVDGLESLDEFSHVILIYWFHRAQTTRLRVKPYLDEKPHGVFATRAPARPNRIGISIVELVRIDGAKIIFRGADMVDGTPLIDIKPFVPEFDNRPNATSGWLAEHLAAGSGPTLSDGRFETKPTGQPKRFS